jgi:hypothetical protein
MLRTLNALRAQAFDDCTTLSSTFKLLDSFEGLLEREAIAAELTKKQVGWATGRCFQRQLSHLLDLHSAALT